jgi:Tol biopolymer transport system component
VGAVNDDEMRRRMDRLATQAPDPAEDRDRVLARAHRRARIGALVAGVGALAIAGLVVVAMGAVVDRRSDLEIADPSTAPTGTVTPSRSDEPSPPAEPAGQIAFWSDSITGGNAHLMLITADGSDRSEVGQLAISTSRLTWSPDGQRVAFDHGIGAGDGQIDVMVDIDTSRSETIFGVGNPQSPDWSPDGERIVFSTDSGALFTIPSGGASGGRPIRQFGPNDFLEGLYPSWSPDGREIAYVDPKTGAIAIVQVQTADDQEPGRTVFDDAIASSLDWGPNGIVASVGRANGGSSLYLIDPTGVDPPQPLPDQAGDEIDPSVSLDGRFIAFVGTAGGQPDLYVMRTSDGTITQITDDARQDRSPVWRPAS